MHVSKTYKVFILTKENRPWRQDKSIVRKYMNRFAIEEDDQFEIHVKDYPEKFYTAGEKIYNAAENVMLKAQKGSGYYRL